MPRRRKSHPATEAAGVTTETEITPVQPDEEDFVDPLTPGEIKDDVLQYMYGTPEPTRLERTRLTLQEKLKSL